MKPIRMIALAASVSCIAQVPAPQTPAPPPLTPTAQGPVFEAPPVSNVVQRNIDAYNAHDARALAETFTPDAQFIQHPGILIYDGKEAIYKGYADSFRKNKNAHCQVLHRSLLGARIVDEAEFTGLGKLPVKGIIIYELRNGLIANIWAIPPE